ncbi:hypothetical protein CROQUDRAFT_662179 [Cronartium quercuum f. sp. fusiforme G11]|uniref:Uncharacterized protein n=1 Tax=Cronartium quercuum f. sp. fusiforme G11 TaxID=708437 RepID=A0A9P6T8L8_9BASI|nr:hypothetical protein CROQUDRAFT_662179 [Cronartium quercuum f. sp. fusiforme G11]
MFNPTKDKNDLNQDISNFTFSISNSPTSSNTSTPNNRTKRTVRFLDEPSLMDESPIDKTILNLLATEDPYKIFKNLARLLDLSIPNPTTTLKDDHFEKELNKRLNHLNYKHHHHHLISDSDSHQNSLLELISQRFEVQDLNDQSHSISMNNHQEQVELDQSWITKVALWCFETLSYVPWHPIAKC